jgi:ribosomal protein S18 acetylase RimI-like enzyme
VSRLELRAFAEDQLDAAGVLLAARHRAHRAAEPLLSERFEDPGVSRAEVASLSAKEHASGAVALRDGKLVGFLLGTPKDDQTWGANVWIEAAGYAAAEPEIVRDLYAIASQRWVDEGRTRHYAVVPALDDQTEAWFRLSFGAQQAHGITAVEARAWPPDTRPADRDDLEALIALAPLVSDHHEMAPVFSGIAWDEEPDALYAVLAAEIANDQVGELVYERDGQIVAGFELAPADQVSMHHGLAQPDRAACITWAASRPDLRGSGAGLALMEAALAWAHEQGYATMVTDWRETNLLSSRFWPARGFRRSFLRLYRSIP